jgi:hypothetical protein
MSSCCSWLTITGSTTSNLAAILASVWYDRPAVVPNYKRGLTRVYIVGAVAWIAWGLYAPIASWKRSIVRFHENVVEETATCKQLNELQAAGSPTTGMTDCAELHRTSLELASILEHKSVYEVYHDAGALKTAAFCVLPPISLYVVILAIVSVALWIGRGFNGDIDVPPGLLPPAQ